jgi:hypothetical protein
MLWFLSTANSYDVVVQTYRKDQLQMVLDHDHFLQKDLLPIVAMLPDNISSK